MDVDIIKVSARSRTASVAGAIAGVMRDRAHAEVQAIGAGAVNQAIKAVAIARGYLLEEGTDIVCIPTFVNIEINGAERTALRLLILPRVGNANKDSSSEASDSSKIAPENNEDQSDQTDKKS